jgi:hypothetical protein
MAGFPSQTRNNSVSQRRFSTGLEELLVSELAVFGERSWKLAVGCSGKQRSASLCSKGSLCSLPLSGLSGLGACLLLALGRIRALGSLPTNMSILLSRGCLGLSCG